MEIVSGSVVIGQYSKFETRSVVINGFPLTCEIADTDAKRIQGLQYRKQLGDKGMLFVFDKPRPEVIFHMVNVMIPLDIVFIDPAGIITKIHKAKPGEKDIKGENVLNVIEVSPGWLEKRGIVVGVETDLIDERSIDKMMLQMKVEELPVEAKVDGKEYQLYVVNGKEYTLTEDKRVIHQTSDAVGTYALAEMFLKMFDTWNELDAENSRKPEDEVIRQNTIVLFQVMMQYFVDRTHVSHREELKRIASVILGKPLDQRSL